MKNIIIALLILAPFVGNSQADASMEKFIRIVGLSEKTFDYIGLEIKFTLSEIQGNEYKQIRPKSIEDVKEDFINALKAEGINPSEVIEDKIKNISKSKYGNTITEHYWINVKNEEEASLVSKLELDGYKISSVEYLFESDYEKYVNEMSVQAIKDARRKAENIAKSIGKTVGEILNIEDTKNLNKSGSSSYSKKTSSKKISYRVNVTFELN